MDEYMLTLPVFFVFPAPGSLSSSNSGFNFGGGSMSGGYGGSSYGGGYGGQGGTITKSTSSSTSTRRIY